MNITVEHCVQDGIERIIMRPHTPRYRTPILFQHGMYHSAQCWRAWQELLTDYGWETHAYSLPGHGQSPVRRPLRFCTLDYYYQFLAAEIKQLPLPPVVVGHSMGGALLQWHFKHGTVPLPAAVFVASWTSHTMRPSGQRAIKLDPVGALLNFLTLSTAPSVRNPQRVAAAFLTPGAIVSADELYNQVGAESLLVLLQYQPPFWYLPRPPSMPLLWLAGTHDALIAEDEEQRSAAYYGADYYAVPEAGHNVMMEKSYHTTLDYIQQWLVKQGVV